MPHSRVLRGRAAMEVLNDDALGLILLRVDSHVSLIRAAAVCRRCRRAIADAAFLRRYRSLHAPTVAGHYHHGTGRSYSGPLFAPSSESMVDASHFSLDFLPGGAGSWTIADSRGSLLLLRKRWPCAGMVVCEPLTRHLEIIPPLEKIEGFTYLINGIEAGTHISMSNFRLLCLSWCNDGVTRTAMFTAGSLWGESNLDLTIPLGPSGGNWYFCFNTEFPDVGDPDCEKETPNCFLTELRDGKPCIITVFNSTVKVFARLDGGEWGLEKSALLWEATSGLPGYERTFFYHPQQILTIGKGIVILSPWFEKPWPYSIDLDTMEAKQATADMGHMLYRCELPWPPALHAHLN